MRGKLKLDDSCISNPEIPKPQIGRVQFEISGFRDLRCRSRPISKSPLRELPTFFVSNNPAGMFSHRYV